MKRNLCTQSCSYSNYVLTALCVLLFSVSANATIWHVGPTRTYTIPSAVTSLVNDGDTVQIDSGTYTDCAVWTKSNLLLQGVGNGYAHCINSVCGLKGIWVINAGTNDITIENMEFSGASISGGSGGNGAGLRAQGGSYTIRHCYFHDNQNGILCNPTTGNDSAEVLIENSVFAHNGCPTGDPSGCNPGYEHNMYIGSGYNSFTLRSSYSHGAINGHNVKTRARNNYILYNSIMDLGDGTSSYDIDIAQGGPTVIMGNIIEGGPNKVNNSIICYNEGSTNAPPQNLYLINNTIINDQTGGYFLFMPLTTNDTITMYNNIFAGPGSLFKGNTNFSVVDSGNNIISGNIAALGLVNAAGYNYNLTDSSPAVNAGTNPGWVYDIGPNGPFLLSPIAQYVDSANSEPRAVSGASIDIGAYEFPLPNGIKQISTHGLILRLIQNASNDELLVEVLNTAAPGPMNLNIYDMTGRLMNHSVLESNSQLRLSTSEMAPGVYVASIQTTTGVCTNKFIVAR